MALRKTKVPVYEAESGVTPDNLPVTRRMLMDVRTELILRIDQSKNEVMAEIHGVKAEIHSMKAEIHSMKADIHGVKADVARIGFLIEEQNVRNKVVLDALTAFMDRQTGVEQRLDDVEAVVRDLAATRPPATPSQG